MEDLSFELEAPTDNDGFIIQQCPGCGCYFKLRPSDIEDDSVLNVRCPSCSVVSDSYFTDDVVELAQNMTMNIAKKEMEKELKKFAKGFNKNGLLKMDIKMDGHQEPETPLNPSFDSLMLVTCKDCGRNAKVSPLLAMSRYTCPFCGIGQFNEH